MSFLDASFRYPRAGLAGDPSFELCVAPGACATGTAATPAGVGEVWRAMLGPFAVLGAVATGSYLVVQWLAPEPPTRRRGRR
jgi:hypothetical protein